MPKRFYELNHWIAIRNGHPMREQNIDVSLNVMLKDKARVIDPSEITIVRASMTDREGSKPYIYAYGTGIPISEDLFYTLVDRKDVGAFSNAHLNGKAGFTHEEFYEYYKHLKSELLEQPSLGLTAQLGFHGVIDSVGCMLATLNYAYNNKVPFSTISSITEDYRAFAEKLIIIYGRMQSLKANK